MVWTLSTAQIRIAAASVAAVIFITGAPTTVRAGELTLASEVMHELNSVLRAGDGLHKSLVAQDDEQIDIGLRDVLHQLIRAKGALLFAKPHERRHLVRILEAAQENFELTRSSYGDERRARLEDGYNQLVNLVRIYRLDRAYGIFFCPKDKTTWVQRGNKPQNPFHPDDRRESCGMRVTR